MIFKNSSGNDVPNFGTTQWIDHKTVSPVKNSDESLVIFSDGELVKQGLEQHFGFQFKYY